MFSKKHFILISLLALVAACSDESKVKDIASQVAQERFETKIKSEADKSVSGKTNIKANYIHSVMEKSEFEINQVKVNGKTAQATIKITSVPPSIRQPTLEIINKIDENKESSFNTSDAINLVYQKMGMNSEQRSEESMRINLHKKEDWVADPEK